MIAARFIVRGKVQGVWFRAATREQALRLLISGCASNLDDGSVEVEAFGDPQAIAILEGWLAKGPPMAQVLQVSRHPLDAPMPDGFSIR